MQAKAKTKNRTKTLLKNETEKKAFNDEEYYLRFQKHLDELKWLYTEVYNNEWMFDELCRQMYQFYTERRDDLKALDRKREADPDWYKKNDMLGVMLYVDNFAGNLQGVKEKLDYLKDSNINYVHLMPLLESPKDRSDGGYAVANFRKVQPELGTMEDLEEVTKACHDRDMSVCMDFVMNHTSEDHEWAVRARRGEGEYMSRYFFYDNYAIPAQFEKTVPQVFPTSAPGNFTYLPELGHYVMTTFYPYQWDLNYRNPRVFNEMMYNFLFFANAGIDVIRIDAVPYIWKELGTSCRNLPRVHTIVRMMRMIGEIVCPGILLLGEVVMEPSKVVPYFGTLEKPECHMLYNVTTMATTWNSVATRDTRLLKNQMDVLASLPKEYVFLNYLRCHDDIGWGLDYPTLRWWGMEERPHKQYINDFFAGTVEGSFSRGELYNADPVTGDARFCATTASMCGVEKAGFEQDEEQMDAAIRRVLMLHAFMFTESGIPMLYSGDEVGQTNDYSYKDVPEKASDSRYIHRGKFRWELVDDIKNEGSVSERIYHGLDKLEKIRASEKVFMSNAVFYTLDTYEQSVICIVREYEDDRLIGLFNFSEDKKIAWIDQQDGMYKDLITGQEMKASGVWVPANGFFWLKREKGQEA
ncbi:MAG TPA: amylosucrase [Candidatus Choladousia intestinavium]|uniref:Amylosucrase n=1 Tax=Candidatus Choladousia intestinavium TaxID=2840727 RepID=A0A9D1ADT2_9FIRM|nr:amylosucrase [Candidatus Choladousia intestinavium]